MLTFVRSRSGIQLGWIVPVSGGNTVHLNFKTGLTKTEDLGISIIFRRQNSLKVSQRAQLYSMHSVGVGFEDASHDLAQDELRERKTTGSLILRDGDVRTENA